MRNIGLPQQGFSNSWNNMYNDSQSNEYEDFGGSQTSTTSNSSNSSNMPNPGNINTNLSSILSGYTMSDKYRDMFAEYDPSKEQFIDEGYKQQFGGLQNSLLGMSNQFRENTASQGFARPIGGVNNMYNSSQYNKLEGQQGLLGLARTEDIYDTRQSFVTDTQDRLADLINSGADIKNNPSSQPWLQYNMTESSYDDWMDETGGDFTTIGQYWGG